MRSQDAHIASAALLRIQGPTKAQPFFPTDKVLNTEKSFC